MILLSFFFENLILYQAAKPTENADLNWYALEGVSQICMKASVAFFV
jgi:hypothetical protein